MPPTDAPLLTTPHALDRLCHDIQHAGLFAIDTEFVSERTYRPELSLIQVATPGHITIVDALALPDLTPLWRLAADPAVTLVVHAGDQEARFCWYATGALPANVLDVQIAAGLVGQRYPAAYHVLVRALLGLRLHQGQTRSDWMRRPLSSAQLAYAAADVEHLLPLRESLQDQLRLRDRLPWQQEESDHQARRLHEELTQDRWWRLAGAGKLGRRELAAVRALYHWREGVAQRRNLPRRRILRDDLILAAVQAMPHTPDDLRRVRGLERLSNRDRASILDTLDTVRALPTKDLPPARRSEGRGPGQERMLALVLEALLESTCVEQDVAATLVGGAADLRRLIDWHLRGRDPDALPGLLRGWRAQVCGDTLEAALAGEVSLRVGDPASAHPILVEPSPPAPTPS